MAFDAWAGSAEGIISFKKKATTVVVLLVCFVTAGFAEGLNGRGTLCISVNPLKVVLGLINLELEYRFVQQVSAYLFSEGLVFDYAIKRIDQPDF